MKWLLSILEKNNNETPLEWSGFMTSLARKQNKTPKPSTPSLFGPLIDSPPAHPDTIMTAMEYFKKYLQGMGMSKVHISLDMQLYIISLQVKWSDPERWKTIITHPGGMHTLMSFLGCIGKLMKGSGLEDILKAAYRGLAGILSGKSWPRAMRALRMVCVALLAEYLMEDRTGNLLKILLLILKRLRKHQQGDLGWTA